MKSPADLHLPWDAWRPGQQLAIRTALTSKRRHIIVQAPTGAGKTAIAGGLTQDDKRTSILTATNGLMGQYESQIPWLAAVRGASNYECLAAHNELKRYFRLMPKKHKVTCDDGPCRSNIRCSLKESGCEYFDAYRNASQSRVVLTNYAYHLAIRNYGQGYGKVDRLVCDEAHTLPEELMKAHQQKIPRYLIQGKMPRTVKDWNRWAEAKLAQLPGEGAEVDDERVKVKRVRETYKVIATIDNDWAWDVDQDMVTFEPTVPRKLFPLLAGDDTQMVYLSATVTPATLSLLDISASDVDFHEMPSRFDLAKRPVYIVPSVRVDNKWSEAEQAWWLRTIDSIIAKRRDRKGIIHTVSYDRARYIAQHSKHSDIMIQPEGKQLPAAVESFKRSTHPMILVSPSIATGYDFIGDECRYQIIAKIPFPNTTSRIMQARIKSTPRYRDNYTMQLVVQMTGRAVRSADDWAETFITDDHANWFLTRREYIELAPEHFLDALQWVNRIPVPPEI